MSVCFRTEVAIYSPPRSKMFACSPVVLEEGGSIVVDVLHDDGEGGGCGFGRDAIINSQDLDLMPGGVLPVQRALNTDRALLINGELALPVRRAVYRVRHFALASLVRIRGLERFQTLTHLGVLEHRHLDVGTLELGLVVVDVAQLDHHPRVSHVVLVVVVVLALVVHLDPESEAVALQQVLIVQRLDDLQRTGAVVVAHHGELVGSVAAVLNNLVLELVGLVLVVHRHSQNGHLRQRGAVSLVHLGEPLVLGELRRHVVYVFHSYGRGTCPFQSATVHRDHLNRIVGRSFPIQTTHGRLNHTRFRFDFEYRRTRFLFDDVLLDRVDETRVRAFRRVVVVHGGHGHDHHAGRAVFGHVAEVDALREYGGVVVDVLEVDLDVGVADQAFATFVLGEDGEAPLRAAVRLISV